MPSLPASPTPPPDDGPSPDPRTLTALHAELAAAACDPWRASLLMSRLGGLRARLDGLRRWLAGLTRTQRRLWARRLALATPAALLALAISAGAPAHADNITVAAGVVVIAADGDCSLREAIINANDDAATHADCAAGNGADTIILPAASTFTVPDIDNVTVGENGLPVIATDITIDGNGSIIERDPMDPDLFRLFHVAATGDLTLDQTTVRYGRLDGDQLEDDGGAVFSYGGLAVTNGSVITGNSAHHGGGISIAYSDASLEITDSTVTANSAYYGGGVYIAEASATITGSTISGNSAEYVAGGVGIYDGSLGITDSTISGNSAYLAGGVGAYLATVSISGSTIAGNSAYSHAGGVGVIGSSLTITGSTITGNSAAIGGFGSGGGVHMVFSAPFYGPLTPSTATITDSTISDNSAFLGGGVYNNLSDLLIDHSTLAGNTAAAGGGLANFGSADSDEVTEIVNSTISGNTAMFSGGGIETAGSLILRNSTITANSAPRGGGVNNGYISPSIVSYVVYSTNTIIADQVAGGDCATYGISVLTSGDYNLDSDNTCNFNQPNDIPAGNANLAPLALNAPGTTATHALLPGSDALDAGNCSGGAVTDDQRGVSRPQGPACDIGAYEREVGAPTPVPPTAAMLAGFTASQDAGGRVTLTWQTTAEAGVAGFNVYRAVGAAGAEGSWVRANSSLIPAQGGGGSGASYRYVDEGAAGIAEPLRYRLEVVNASGPPQSFGPVDALRRLFRAVLPWVGRNSAGAPALPGGAPPGPARLPLQLDQAALDRHADQVDHAVRVQLGHQRRAMALHRLDADAEAARDRPIGMAGADQAQHFKLTRGQAFRRAWRSGHALDSRALRQELGGHLRAEKGRAMTGGADRQE